ncbi:hypothetical protein LLE49_07680 [Alicyclobacillus tolerans]|uniref:hypothetical protein n=1 Tax=Alicyclobacillus tolerans TaxID=90970 RepID=UPI001F4038AC|nr:hypothetical protein [Alicyclobacillus tolerans]MCF8564624.1 hypothetical protein [Alicyclobacillus tolerans]
MNETELAELRDSIQRLETKIDKLLERGKKRSGFLWKEFIVGFVVVYIFMMVLAVVFGLLNQHVAFFH